MYSLSLWESHTRFIHSFKLHSCHLLYLYLFHYRLQGHRHLHGGGVKFFFVYWLIWSWLSIRLIIKLCVKMGIIHSRRDLNSVSSSHLLKTSQWHSPTPRVYNPRPGVPNVGGYTSLNLKPTVRNSLEWFVNRDILCPTFDVTEQIKLFLSTCTITSIIF
jgi:hypothetical protein